MESIRYAQSYNKLLFSIKTNGVNNPKTKELARIVLKKARVVVEYYEQFDITKLPDLSKTTPYKVLNDPKTKRVLNLLSKKKKAIFYHFNYKKKFLKYQDKFILVSVKDATLTSSFFLYNPEYKDGTEVQSWVNGCTFHSCEDIKMNREGYLDNIGNISILERALMKQGYGIIKGENEILMFGQFDQAIGPDMNLMRMEVTRNVQRKGIETLIKGFPATMSEMEQEAGNIVDYVLKKEIIVPEEVFMKKELKHPKPVFW